MKLKQIWDDQPLSKQPKLLQSPFYGSEDETASTVSMSENQGLNHSSPDTGSFELTPVKQRKSSGKTSFMLSELLPITEISNSARNEIISQIVNERQGYINVLKFAEMIADSLKNEATVINNN